MNGTSRRGRKASTGFTLVELLVVIGIIALLISILLPSLARAKRAANTVACAANIRSILQGMNMYASQNGGAIPGSAWTTARFMFSGPGGNINTCTTTPYTDQKCPSVVSIFDWATPIMRVMGVKIREEGDTPAERVGDPVLPSGRVDRWTQIRQFPGFRCPENQVLGLQYGTFRPAVDVMLSYNTSIIFLVQSSSKGSGSAGGRTTAFSVWSPNSSYTPNLTKVGNGSKKIYISDGARYSNCGTLPDVDLSITGQHGGSFGDQGAWTKFSNSWDRGKAAGNTPRVAGQYDARVFAYRHGLQKQNGPTDAYKANFGFFDGHVELLGDLQSARPDYWMPKGTDVTVDGVQCYPDVIKAYYGGVNFKGPMP